jgi:hypothetical protein
MTNSEASSYAVAQPRDKFSIALCIHFYNFAREAALVFTHCTHISASNCYGNNPVISSLSCFLSTMLSLECFSCSTNQCPGTGRTHGVQTSCSDFILLPYFTTSSSLLSVPDSEDFLSHDAMLVPIQLFGPGVSCCYYLLGQ